MAQPSYTDLPLEERREFARRWFREQRAAQSFGPKVTDPVALDKIARAFEPALTAEAAA